MQNINGCFLTLILSLDDIFQITKNEILKKHEWNRAFEGTNRYYIFTKSA
jgi:hypothetical protein